MSKIIKISAIDPRSAQLETLGAEAEEQGYKFVERLMSDAKSGKNTFDKKGESFCGVFLNGALVGCGGVNVDPYSSQVVGRLLHVYILERVRRAGIATVLVKELLRRSGSAFHTIRLRASDSRADKFYEALGFQRTEETGATHRNDV